MNGRSNVFSNIVFQYSDEIFGFAWGTPSEQFAEQLPIDFNWENKRSNSANASYDGSTEQQIVYIIIYIYMCVMIHGNET